MARFWDTPSALYWTTVCDAVGPWTDLGLEEDWGVRLPRRRTRYQAPFHRPDYVAGVRDITSPAFPGWKRWTGRLAHLARSRRLIYGHARRAGIDESEPAMQRFGRALFLLARQCGATGMDQESRELFAAAKSAVGAKRGRGLDFQLYALTANFLGWPLAGKIACAADRLRR